MQFLNTTSRRVLVWIVGIALGWTSFRLGDPFWPIFVFAVSPFLLAVAYWMDLRAEAKRMKLGLEN
ncbi:MAG: hypothetical protein KF833_17145 [Verrucomicrobiae bacterium]|nr:hypothetical protein [Verrucomicrobiae bacterium]